MELSWRTALIVLGLALVVWIVVDGIKRMRRARAEALKLDVDPGFVSARDELDNPELPNGGWRAVRPKQENVAEPLVFVDDPLPVGITPAEDKASETSVDFQVRNETTAPQKPAPAEKPAPVQKPAVPKTRPVNLDEQVPVLLDVEELGEAADELPSFEVTDENTEEISRAEQPLKPQAVVAEDKVAAPAEPIVQMQPAEELEPVQPEMSQPAPREEAEPQPVTLPVNLAHPDAEKLSDRPAAEISLVIHCIAPKGKHFDGKDVLYVFNSCDLRFGERDIFHRFEAAEGRGCIQFSVVHSFEPQTFDPKHMAQQSFGGLSFFMKLPGPKMSLQAFEVMLGMAKMFEEKFDAELFDGERSALTQQTIEHSRQQIIEYERRQHLAEKKRMRG